MSDSALATVLLWLRLITLATQYHAASSTKNRNLQSRCDPDGKHDMQLYQ